MKLSDKTINLLKNFSTINQSILFKHGSKLRTISVMKNILAEATIDEELPVKEQEEDVFGEKFEIPAFLRKVH